MSEREEAIQIVDDVMLAGLRALKPRAKIAAEVVDAILALPDSRDPGCPGAMSERGAAA